MIPRPPPAPLFRFPVSLSSPSPLFSRLQGRPRMGHADCFVSDNRTIRRSEAAGRESALARRGRLSCLSACSCLVRGFGVWQAEAGGRLVSRPEMARRDDWPRPRLSPPPFPCGQVGLHALIPDEDQKSGQLPNFPIPSLAVPELDKQQIFTSRMGCTRRPDCAFAFKIHGEPVRRFR